jgi:hypothetical protein
LPADKELRSNGWNFVVKVATEDAPQDHYFIKTTYRQFENLMKQLSFRFPYAMDFVQPPFPPRQTVKVDDALTASSRQAMLDPWLQDVVLKKALFESTEMLTYLLRDDLIAYIKSSDDLLEADKSEWSTAADASGGGSESLAVSIVGAQEERTQSGQFLLFILEMREAGEVWHLVHRYDSFFALSHELTRLFPDISTVKLPPTKLAMKQTGRAVFGTSRKIDPKFIDQRKVILWHFVR